MSTAVRSAKEKDLKPLTEESAEALDLDPRQITVMERYLHHAWFFGIRTGHAVMVETKMKQGDAESAINAMQDEFQELMERCAAELNTTVGATIEAWNYLGSAWVAGIQFWEIEIVARLIEFQAGDFEQNLERLEKRQD